MFEHRKNPLLPMRQFIRRSLRHAGCAVLIVGGSLGIGIVGYHVLEGFSWVVSLLNASMLLGGMGPVGELKTDAGKIFASLYALFSGMVFLVAAGVLFAPFFHRFLHRFHLDMEEGNDPGVHAPRGGRAPAKRK